MLFSVIIIVSLKFIIYAPLPRLSLVLRQVHRRTLWIQTRHSPQRRLSQNAKTQNPLWKCTTVFIQEWRSLGVQQSRGWVHYELHKPEPHILLFRRPKGTDPQTGLPPAGFVAPPDTFVYWMIIANLLIFPISPQQKKIWLFLYNLKNIEIRHCRCSTCHLQLYSCEDS